MSRRILKTVIAVAAAVSLTAAAKNVTGNDPVEPVVELDRPKVALGYEGPIYVLVDLAAIEIENKDEDRPELNLGLVLDRSGSMESAGKIEYLKRASGLAIDQLASRDRLSVVEYDDEITVLFPSGLLESPGHVKSLINQLEPRGSTDLVGGMMRGVSEVMSSLGRSDDREDRVSRVLLLSDGLANRGITDHARIGELVRSAKAKGVRISTLGLGRDYDEDLMQLIAENGGGHYYYIESPNQMARIFQEELMTMFQTVARDVSLEMNYGSKVEGVEAVSFDFRSLEPSEDIDLGDFYSGEKRTVVFRIEPEPDAFDRRGKVELAEIDLVYRDAETGKKSIRSYPIVVDVVRSRDVAEASINARVIVETMLLETEREHERAVKLYEAGEQDEADGILDRLATEAADYSKTYDDKRLSQKAEALRIEQGQMKDVAMAPEARSDYLKKSKQRLFMSKQGSRSLYSLEEGDKGLNVERLQEALAQSGDYKGKVDGVFSEEVRVAVEAFQTREGLSADGIAGPATLSALGLY